MTNSENTPEISASTLSLSDLIKGLPQEAFVRSGVLEKIKKTLVTYKTKHPKKKIYRIDLTLHHYFVLTLELFSLLADKGHFDMNVPGEFEVLGVQITTSTHSKQDKIFFREGELIIHADQSMLTKLRP